MIDYEVVQITHETFKSARREYDDWRQAWVREILQNSIDAMSTFIDVTIDGNKITVYDNGCGMNEDILRNKLFVMNASSKNCESSVGGFGKAKELLFFGQNEYQIFTNDFYVHGIAHRYKISKKDFEIGTKIVVDIDDEDSPRWYNYFAKFIKTSSWKGTIKIDGDEIKERLVAGDKVTDFDFGTLCRRHNADSYMLVRVGGMPMYETYIGNNTSLVLDLKGKSYDLLTANRDNMTGAHKQAVQAWICDFNKNSKTALIKKNCKVTLYKGKKGILVRKSEKEEVPEDMEMIYRTPEEHGPIIIKTRDSGGDSIKLEIERLPDIKANVPYDCVVQNMLTHDIPTAFTPNYFGVNARWVLNAWTVAIYELHKIFNVESAFYTGFIFSKDFEACQGNYGGFPMFLLNPVDNECNIKYQKKRFYACKMLAIAVHEFSHIFSNYHDEEFASKLTDRMGIILDEGPHLIKKMLEGEVCV